MKPLSKEEEEKRLRKQLELAQSTNNITALMNIIVGASSLSEDDYIRKTLGALRLYYYMFLDLFHVRPRDMIELIDGVLYSDIKSYVCEQESNRLKRMQQEKQ